MCKIVPFAILQRLVWVLLIEKLYSIWKHYQLIVRTLNYPHTKKKRKKKKKEKKVKVQTTALKFGDFRILRFEILEYQFYSQKLKFVFTKASPSIFSIKCHINLSHVFNSLNKMMSCVIMKMTWLILLDKLNTHSKFMWHLMENMDKGTANAN